MEAERRVKGEKRVRGENRREAKKRRWNTAVNGWKWGSQPSTFMKPVGYLQTVSIHDFHSWSYQLISQNS